MDKRNVELSVGVGRTLRDFLTHTSSHGLKYLGEDDRPRTEKTFWIVAVSLGLATATFMVLNIYWRYTGSATVMTLQDTHYPTWKIPFPAVTLCNPHPVLTSRANAIIDTLHLPAYMNRSGALAALKDLSVLINPDEENTQLTQELQDLLRLNRLHAYQLMPELSQPCSEMLEMCVWESKLIDCQEWFHVEKSHFGFCCSFNYYLNSPDNSPLYSRMIDERMGLQVLVKPELSEFRASAILSNGFAIQIHDPYEYPDEHGIIKMVPLNTEVFIPVRSTVRQSNDKISRMSISKRKCVYPHEMELKFLTRYINDNCLTECRVNYTLRHCACIPYFYPNFNDVYRTCDLTDVNCIYQISDETDNFRPSYNVRETEVEDHKFHARAAAHSTNSISCNCPAQCEAVKMEVRVSFAQLAQSSYSFSPMMGRAEINMTDRILINVYRESDLSHVIQSDEKVSVSNLLGLLGGIASLFLGCSFVTPIEFVYFVTVRLPGFLKQSSENSCSCPNSPRAVYPGRYLSNLQEREARFPSVRTQNKVKRNLLW